MKEQETIAIYLIHAEQINSHNTLTKYMQLISKQGFQ